MKRKKNIWEGLIIGIFIFLVIVPILTILVWVGTERWAWPSLIPQKISMRAVNGILRNRQQLVRLCMSSLFISASVAFLSVVIGTMTARALECYDFFGKRLFSFMSMLPFLVPGTVFAMGVQITFIKCGLSGTVQGVIIVHLICSLPYAVTLMQDGTRAIGVKLENQARSAVIHLDYPAFTRCFQQFMEAGLREVHSPQEIREVCIRFAYAVINTAKECGTLRDEDLLVQKILHTILNAVFWEEIMDAMLELFVCIENDEKKQTSAELLVQKALSIIKECYSDGINLEETARRLHVTEQYLGTQLKKETGSSFTEIIRRYKIAHVKQLLLDTELKLNQIASMAGFSDPKYMSKVFKQEVGMLPNEYRRMNT